MKLEIGQVVSQIFSFLIMLWVLTKFAWKPILKVLDDRRDKIKAEFDSIEEQNNELAKMKEEYRQKINNIEEEARKRYQQAVEKGTMVAQEIQEKAYDKAKTILQKAEADAQNEILKAKSQLKNEMVSIAFAAAEKILKTNLDREKQTSLIVDSINQAGFN